MRNIVRVQAADDLRRQHNNGTPKPTIHGNIEMSSTTPADLNHNSRLAVVIKWVASIIQILGYTATGFGWTPWNIYLFLVGLVGWFTVGVLWNDRAIMLIHIVALGAMSVGLVSSQILAINQRVGMLNRPSSSLLR